MIVVMEGRSGGEGGPGDVVNDTQSLHSLSWREGGRRREGEGREEGRSESEGGGILM